MAAKSPKQITIFGRLSFPTLTAVEAFELSKKGIYPAASKEEAKPSLQLVVEQAQFDKLVKHARDEFLPYAMENEPKKEPLTQAEVTRILDFIDAGDFADDGPNTPFKPVHEKTQELAPEAYATIKAIGNKGIDIEQKAIVTDETELAVPDPDQLSFPVVLPLNKTTHRLYSGAYVGVTLNLYAYRNGKTPGFSAGCSAVVFKADMDQFGGGVAVDDDAIFAD